MVNSMSHLRGDATNMRKEKKKMTAKQTYDGYALPRSSELGQPFVDFNEVLRKIIPKKVKTVKKRRSDGRI